MTPPLLESRRAASRDSRRPIGSPRHGATILAASLLALVACQSAPERTIPDPLPETLEWALPVSDGSAFLGLEVRENDSGSLESLSFDPGVRVHSVVERSPAAASGILTDDVLISFDGVEIAAPEDLEALLDRTAGGSRVKLGLQRGDAVFDVELTLGGEGDANGPSATEAFVLDPARTRGAWGTSNGAVLVSRADDGPVGILPVGTRVVALDGQPIVSGRGLVKRLVSLDPGTVVVLSVEEPGEEPGERTSDLRIELLDEGRRTTRASLPILMTYDAAADRSTTKFVLLDLYLISLFRYERDGSERRWRVLRFIEWSSGVGELDE